MSKGYGPLSSHSRVYVDWSFYQDLDSLDLFSFLRVECDFWWMVGQKDNAGLYKVYSFEQLNPMLVF